MHAKNLNHTEGKPYNWWTGITLFRIGEIDTVKGTYEMYFNHWVQVFENDTLTDFKNNPPEFDYVNLFDIELNSVPNKGIIQKHNYYDVKIQETFYTNMDFKKFPFEKLNLNILVEPGYNYTSISTKGKSGHLSLSQWLRLDGGVRQSHAILRCVRQFTPSRSVTIPLCA